MMSNFKFHKTSFPELTYAKIEPGLWRIFSQWDGEKEAHATGKFYATQIELLCDIDRYAKECGC
jgi:hypothetical protein